MCELSTKRDRYPKPRKSNNAPGVYKRAKQSEVNREAFWGISYTRGDDARGFVICNEEIVFREQVKPLTDAGNAAHVEKGRLRKGAFGIAIANACCQIFWSCPPTVVAV